MGFPKAKIIPFSCQISGHFKFTFMAKMLGGLQSFKPIKPKQFSDSKKHPGRVLEIKIISELWLITGLNYMATDLYF